MVGLGGSLGDARCHEDSAVDEALVSGEAFDDFAHFEVPNYDLGVLSCARDKPIALADVEIRNVIEVAVETGLQSERVSVPHFQNPTPRRSRQG